MSVSDINWSATLHATSGPVALGDLLCMHASAETYVRATTANFAAVGILGGVALSAGAPTDTIRIQYTGEVPATVTGLGVGAVAAVGVSALGRMVRLVGTIAAGTVILGDCDARGNVRLSPASIVNPVSAGVPDTSIVAGAGLTGGGLISAGPLTLDVVANADASIIVNASDIQVGVLATDAQHGVRGGGTQHAAATTSVAGFMSAADKVLIDQRRATPADADTLYLWSLSEAATFVHSGTAAALNMSVSTAIVATGAPGLFGSCAYFYDAPGKITSAKPLINPSTTAVTFSMWVRHHAFSNAYAFFKVYRGAEDVGTWTAPFTSVVIGMDAVTQTYYGLLNFGGGNVTITAPGSTGCYIDVGDWNYVAMSFDNSNIYMHVNGTLGGTVAQAGPIDYGPVSGASYGLWGAGAIYASASHLRVDNRVVSATEQRDRFMRGLGRFG